MSILRLTVLSFCFLVNGFLRFVPFIAYFFDFQCCGFALVFAFIIVDGYMFGDLEKAHPRVSVCSIANGFVFLSSWELAMLGAMEKET